MNETKEAFNNYILQLIVLTFGFTPTIKIEMPNEGIVKIFLDGSEDQRKQIMGHHAQNFHALRRLLVCFSRRYDVYAYLYLNFKNEEDTTIY